MSGVMFLSSSCLKANAGPVFDLPVNTIGLSELWLLDKVADFAESESPLLKIERNRVNIPGVSSFFTIFVD